MIIVPSSVIFDGNYKFDVVGIDTESALNNSKIKTIFDNDPAGSVMRPARQADGVGLKIYQNMKVLMM